MLPPHELKNKTFSRVLRGYNSVEVDEQINFILDKYTELYRQNDELERKLKLAEAKLAEFRSDEESIRSALVNAQKASAKIIGEANERADVVMRSARNNCNRIIASFRGELQKERDELLTLRRAVAEFKARLFAQYQQHITYIEQISPDDDATDADTPDEVFVRRVVNQVKEDITGGKIQDSLNDVKMNTEAEDGPIIPVYNPKERAKQEQPSFREITRSQPASKPPEYKPSGPEPDKHDPKQGLDSAIDADSSKDGLKPRGEPDEPFEASPDDTETNEFSDSGGGYLDEIIEEEIIAQKHRAAGDSDGNADDKNEPSDSGGDLPFGGVKPGARPSTIAAEPLQEPDQPKSDDGATDGNRQNTQNIYRSASVKDTIRELNKKFAAGEQNEAPSNAASKSADGYTPDAEDEELLSMIRSVTNAAEEKDREAGNKKKNKLKPLSLTEEFDLISEDDNTTDGR